MKTNYRLKKLFALLVIVTTFAALTQATYAQTWNPLGTGTSGQINAMTVFNGNLIAAGTFVTAGGTTVNNIAMWNGTTWTALGTGMDSVINCLAVFNGVLYAGGKFTMAGGTACNRIARWNGTAWSSLGLGLNGECKCMLVYAAQLRVGGLFTTAGGITCTRIARWDGTTWIAFTGNGANGEVDAMALFGAAQDLIIGGAFTNVSGTNANRIIRYNGAFFALGTGLDNGSCLALASPNNTSLYVGGTFSTIGGSTVNNLAKWSGTNWSNLGTGTNGPVKCITVSGANIVIGGSFVMANGTTYNNIVSYNGSAFAALGGGFTGGTPSVNAITPWSNVLIAGGLFTTATSPQVAVSNIAAYGSLPVAPTLISPPNASTYQSTTPTLDWSDVAGASTYGVQLSKNPNMVPLLVDVNGLATSQYAVPSGAGLALDSTYFWRANATNGLGTGPNSSIFFFTTGLVGVINQQEIPLAFNLYQNYPNPFNPVTKIRFDLPAGISNGKLKLEVFNIAGKSVATLVNTAYVAGKWEVNFDAGNMPSGAYFYKITAGNFSAVNKMILIK